MIVDGLAGRRAGEVIGYAALVCATVIAARFLGISCHLVSGARPAATAPRRAAGAAVVGSWAGMRGAVSLAAALALPLETDAGDPLPGRELILFITFALILVTVVGQGLTLPGLIRRLGVFEDGTEEEDEEFRARLVAARAALNGSTSSRPRTGPATTRSNASWPLPVPPAALQDPGGQDRGRGRPRGPLAPYQRMMHEVYAAQRQALVGLRNRARSPAR